MIWAIVAFVTAFIIFCIAYVVYEVGRMLEKFDNNNPEG